MKYIFWLFISVLSFTLAGCNSEEVETMDQTKWRCINQGDDGTQINRKLEFGVKTFVYTDETVANDGNVIDPSKNKKVRGTYTYSYPKVVLTYPIDESTEAVRTGLLSNKSRVLTFEDIKDETIEFIIE